MSVLSCLRAGTDVHVAWVVEPPLADPHEAVAVTPGGGRMGSLLGGALDHTIRAAARSLEAAGSLVEVPLGPAEALVTGHPEGTTVTLALIAGSALPVEVWEDLAAGKATRFSFRVSGRVLDEPERLEPGEPGIECSAYRLLTSFVPIPRVVIAGSGPIAAALADAFGLIEWQAAAFADAGTAAGVMATLTRIDAIVVLGHEVETAGRALEAAIKSKAGYIGSIGSPRMQQLRRDWLAYRGVDWDDRVRAPAGLRIGAASPPEIAISIVAEAISIRPSP
jgi:xanthine dehydrogenase accessory factor